MPVAPPLSLQHRPSGRIRPQLDELQRVLEILGNPQRKFPSVLIVGTNGKGSTASMLEAIFRSHGLVTGLYTSPHLVSVRERVRIEGQPVAAPEFDEQIARLDRFPDLTFFETLTAAAFLVFARRGVDVAILEAGMGGSWDATRLARSAIAGLTNIGSDHAAWLGADRRQIARDKGEGLAAARWPVLGAGVEEHLRAEVGAPDAARAEFIARTMPHGEEDIKITWEDGVIVIKPPLPGAHQHDNVQLAVALALRAVDAGWLEKLDPPTVRRALERTRWPGRLSIHRIGNRRVLLDCAHNYEAVRALAQHLEAEDLRYNLLFSCLDDKPVEKMAGLLEAWVDSVVVCELDAERAMPIERLLAAFPGAQVAASPASGLEALPDPVLAAGSIRLVGALLAADDAEIGW